MAILNIKVTPSNGIVAYWIAVGFDDVDLVNGEGSIQIEEDQNHILTWWMNGNPGSSLAIKGENIAGTTIVEVKQSRIPAGENQGAGAKRFNMV